MVRIKWQESLITALLCGGMAWAQQPPMTAPAGAGNTSILTLKEAGKPDQRCRVLKTRRTPDGKTEYEIQDLATGEIATIVESGPATLNAAPASSPGPLHFGQPAVEKAPAAPAAPRGWLSRRNPLPESPVVPTRTETGHLDPVAQVAAGGQELPESQPSPGFLHRVRRFFGRGEAEETTTAVPPSRFLNGTSGSPVPLMQRMPSPAGVSEVPAAGTLSPMPARPSFPTPVPAPSLNGQGAAAPAPVPGLNRPVASSPYANLEPVRLTGAPTLQMANFSRQVASLSRHEVLAILRDSPYPSQREVAVESLAGANWHTDPNVIPILIETATEDAAATVRAACVRALVGMGANTGPVLETLHRLQSDPDAQVRREAQAARVALAAQAAPSARGSVVPAGLR